jgi:nicotinic acid mononucleotide adenylyltransferase|tara:strand:+ start:1576 stop:4125 length:2550 start_codon:yes stop_codon:yes gene_type:complete
MKKPLKDKNSTTATGKTKDEIVLNPAHVAKKSFSEATTDTAVVTFGRMNPPTVGHLALVEKMLSISLDERAQPLIFLSHSYDPKKNPLAYEEKLDLVKKAFGEEFVAESESKNMFDMLKEVNQRFKNVIVVVGEDRIKDLERITSTYNGKDFHYESMRVVNAGLRDPDSDGIEGMSASKMRELAVEGNLTEFREGLPSQLHASAEVIINMIREGMNLSEELNKIFETYLDEAGVLTVAGRRKKAVAARKYKSRLKIARRRVQRRVALNPRLKKRTARASIRIMRNRLAGGRGKSYSKLSAQEKSSIDKRVRSRSNIITKLSARLLPQTRRKEFSRFKSFREAAEHINYSFEAMLAEGGLWANIHKKRKEGRPMRKPGSKGAPTKQNFKDAAEGTYMGTFDKDAIDKHDKKKKKPVEDKKGANEHSDVLENGDLITHESYQLTPKALNALIEKAERSDLSIESIIEYYTDGMLSHNSDDAGTLEQAGFRKVNEAIAKGKSDADALFELNRHGVPKDATKAELEKIRSTGSPGAKKLAHWKLNMHKESYSGEPEHIIQQVKRDVENQRSERLKKKKSPANPNVRSNPNMSIKEGGDVKDYIEVKGGKMSKAEVAKLVKSRKKEMAEADVPDGMNSRPSGGYTGDRVVHGQKGYKEYMAQAKRKKAALDVRISNNAAKKSSEVDSNGGAQLKETAGLMGTDALRKRYEMDTPGQTSHSKYEVAVDGVPGKDGIHKPRISTFKESVSEAVFDADTPKKGIQRTRQHLSFKSSKPKVYKLRQKQDLYKKDDSQADKEKKSESDRRYPEWVYKQDKKKKTSTGTPTRQPTKKDVYKKDGERSDKYGGDNHPITKH